jgi:diketogulonate reductase-like aldo/keto reductase
VGEAMRGERQRLFVVVKIWPSHAVGRAFEQALAGSLRRLGTDHADLVLLHWPTRSFPTEAVLEALRGARERGLARHIGLSNHPLPTLEAIWERTAPGELGFQELPYALGDRRVERSILPALRRRGDVLLAYSPLAHGRLRRHPGFGALAALARARGVAPETLALAALLQEGGVVALPKAARVEHVRANAAAADLVLTPEERADLSRAFPPPTRDFRPALPPYLAFHRLAWAAVQAASGRRGPPPRPASRG